MKIIKKNLSELRHPEKNIRLHTDKQLREFRRSVEMFGQIRPIVIDEYNVILAGNGLYETLQQLGYSEADCYVVTGLTEKQKKKLMMSDNRIFDLGVDDMSVFDSFIDELKDDLDIPGFDEDMLKSLVMDTPEVDELISEYGVVSQNRAEEIRETRKTYEERDAVAAQCAVEHKVSTENVADSQVRDKDHIQNEVREAVGYAAPYKAEEAERRYILCPKCGERIWL